MLRSNNSTTILLVLIVLILFAGLGITIYYVLDLDWFTKQSVQIYNEFNPNNQQQNIQIKVEKEIKYDITKRTYNLVINSDQFKIVIYKDGTVGITMLENDMYKEIKSYSEFVNKEIKAEVTNIIRAYNIKASKDSTPKSYMVLLDGAGNVYRLNEQEILTNGKYVFEKIQGLAKIIDIRQITNDGLTVNNNGINVIAIDEESNELLLTDYLLK